MKVAKGRLIKVKMRNKNAEWIVLNKYFGSDAMSIWFNDFSGYENARENATYQQVYDVVAEYNVVVKESINNLNQ